MFRYHLMQEIHQSIPFQISHSEREEAILGLPNLSSWGTKGMPTEKSNCPSTVVWECCLYRKLILLLPLLSVEEQGVISCRGCLRCLPWTGRTSVALRHALIRSGICSLEIFYGQTQALSRLITKDISGRTNTHCCPEKQWHQSLQASYEQTLRHEPHWVFSTRHTEMCNDACHQVRSCMHAQSCLTLYNPTDCSPPGSSVHVILQARRLEWVAISTCWGIFPTQGLNSHFLSLLHYRKILYHLSHWRSSLSEAHCLEIH